MMKSAKPAVLVACLAATLGAVAAPRSGPSPGATEALIQQLETQRFKAMIEVNEPELNRILGDDMTYTHSSGHLDSKSTYVASLKSGELKYEFVSPSDVRVRVYGSTAVVTGRADVKARTGGKETVMTIRYTDVYVRRNGRWQMVAWHSSRVAEP